MYIVVREDLGAGPMIAQSCHAMSLFIEEHNDVAKKWMSNSNYLAVLSVSDEQALLDLISKASKNDIKFSIFFEPDLRYAITAIALEPNVKSKKLCAKFPLALKNKQNVVCYG